MGEPVEGKGPEGTNVWVGSLPPGVDDETFNSLFSPYGTITSAKVYTEKCYGFVAFTSVDEAKNVVDTLNGADCGGKTIQVRFADNNVRRGTTVSNVPTTVLAKGGGGYGPWKGGGGGGGGGDWKGGGGGYGAGCGGHSYWGGGGGGGCIESGWGCTPYGNGKGTKGGKDPMMAIAASVMKPPSPMAPVGKGGGNKGFGGSICDSQDKVLVGKSWAWTRGSEDCNVFIKNLPEAADEFWLYRLCAPMGSILSTFAKTTDKGRIGFVTFGSVTEAQYAIDNLTGLMAIGSDLPLHLSVQHKKDKAKKGGKGKGKDDGGKDPSVMADGASDPWNVLGNDFDGAGDAALEGGCESFDGGADAGGGFEAWG